MAKISVLIEAFKNYAPKEYSNFSKEMFDDNNNIKYKYYENIPEISIDYAIMEKSDNMACVIPETQWTDYGSWKSIYNSSKKDSKKNVIKGNVISDNVKESFIYSSKELVAVSALKDTIVVETEDAVLVCDKSRAGDINKLVTKLKENNENAAFVHKTVFKPWGFSTCLNKGKDWLSKVITISAGQKISTHYHNYRSEHWVILEGSAVITLNNSKYTLEKHQSIDIPTKIKHSLHNNTKNALKILEVQKGEYIGEDDIIR
ncbi:MAG: cupin domain-containing protein [Candidatus Gastranaerophilales bacterium]|nr:cupin domain-containing protein [Candidatus Gastranaerophilales bacterium]